MPEEIAELRVIALETDVQPGLVKRLEFAGEWLAGGDSDRHLDAGLRVTAKVELYSIEQPLLSKFAGHVKIVAGVGGLLGARRTIRLGMSIRDLAKELASFDAAEAFFRLPEQASMPVGGKDIFGSMQECHRLIGAVDEVRRSYRHALTAMFEEYHGRLYSKARAARKK